ncbi:CPBP family intramembrane glutamic endopeptidase [Lactiplantibacillus plantarum]|uniref:CPBP family intramembrane glutamic endopeptidase n=1 Tax=Lactiplantibacillus plantarum TaxID=1590 RepID=UPI0021A423D8|nr:CPBP family intramembrane glutamic endopeptidase [Lactiplantibacillus plantarum]MCT3206428.1 CPBP family intramembrane metalloprotease [Lactiplantibacillus plantarum]MCT3220202.1 CPBP family intramembrane metalloprotease [Lactiplantibacillus plantarum]MCT3281522.1 CPBP family intramembrane metalloprotease [Lactiplantibacillus plantarum]
MRLVVKVLGWLGLILIEQWATGVCLTGLQAKSAGATIFLLGSGTLVLIGLVLGLSYSCRQAWWWLIDQWRPVLINGGVALVSLLGLSLIVMTIMHRGGQVTTTNQQNLTTWLASLHGWRQVWLISQMVIIAPMLEELLFRGLFCHWFLVQHQVWQALLSAALFASVHEMRLSLSWVLYFGAGLILVVLYQRQQDLKVNIVVHGLYNLISLV